MTGYLEVTKQTTTENLSAKHSHNANRVKNNPLTSHRIGLKIPQTKGRQLSYP